MQNIPSNTLPTIVHSNDFLLRIQRGAGRSTTIQSDASRVVNSAVGTSEFGELDLIANDPDRRERMAVRRSDRISTSRVRNFGGCYQSEWALDLLATRFTEGAHDWRSLRHRAIRFAEEPRAYDRVLDRIRLADLWALVELLHARDLDSTAERALLTFVSSRVIEGKEFKRSLTELLVERLLHAGLDSPAGELVSRLDGSTWRKHSLAVELEHPRFGGDYEDLLFSLNSGYYQFGLERLSLDGDGEHALQRLSTEPAGAAKSGPPVTIVMTTADPGVMALTAARSIVNQTYRDWELIVIDDASPQDFAPILNKIDDLDSRVRIIRTSTRSGRYANLNDALKTATGEFVTFQNENAWSHPRRIETQVRDLLTDSDKLANVVRESIVGDDLSLVGSRGARPVLSESSILFRRQPVIEMIGYFDLVHFGAGTEYRRRLEAATGAKIDFVGPEVPLEFASSSSPADARTDFEIGMWSDPEWLAYREAAAQFHKMISTGEKDPYLPATTIPKGRPFPAPSKWIDGSDALISVDLLVILDGRRSNSRNSFIDAVVDELYFVTATGARVALLQSDSADGAEEPGPLAPALQEFIDSGRVIRVFDHDEVEAETVVVRHAVSVQGHASRDSQVKANQVVVVEDIEGGDLRGETFAQFDVDEALRSWFSCVPEWVIAGPVMQRPVMHSVVVEDETVRLTITAPDARQISAIRFDNGREVTDLIPRVDVDDYVVASGALDGLPEGELMVVIVRHFDESEVIQGCQVKHNRVISSRSNRMLIADDRLLRLLPAESTYGTMGSSELVTRFLATEASSVRIFRDQIELTLEHGDEVNMVAMHLLREVGGHIRRHEFSLDQQVGSTQTAIRPLEGILDTRWKVFGMFQTPFGLVSAPINFGPDTPSYDSEQYRVRKLSSDGSGIIHIVEQPKREASDHTPVLSIVMPVFNVAPYLDTAIQSVLTQDFQDFELIVVDDASTDNGRQVVEMHQSLDDRIRLIGLDHNTLGGAGVPSNLGIRAARGKYIGFVDSDDWVTKGAFAKLVELAERHEAELVVGDFRTFDENDRSVSDAYDAGRWRNIPLEKIVSASSHPDLMRLSPVPWRKLYRRDFVQKNQVLYPEGDYFYEDNPLHWHVLSRADRVVATDQIVSYHRMEREGQTMGAFEYKLSAIASHANTILTSLQTTTADHREVLFEEFIDYISRQRWIVRRQTQPAAARMIQKRLVEIYDRAVESEPSTSVPQATVTHFAKYRSAYPGLDLTVVIPVYNSADLLASTLDSVLAMEGLSYDVLLIDDGSTDESLDIMRKYEQRHSNVHVFQQKNRGAGRARNAVIPMCTGRYTYFLDADDVVKPSALRQAVSKADQDDADLLLFQYRIELVDEGTSRGMFNADSEVWRNLSGANSNTQKQNIAINLINYPWNRIIRTSLLHNSNIFFGPTIVHNDILFHWHTILSATNIGHLDVEVCTHRKFENRAQVTNIRDERRMAVLEALRGTHQRIMHLPAFEIAKSEWHSFVTNLLRWAEDRVPERLRDVYRERSQEFLEAVVEDEGAVISNE